MYNVIRDICGMQGNIFDVILIEWKKKLQYIVILSQYVLIYRNHWQYDMTDQYPSIVNMGCEQSCLLSAKFCLLFKHLFKNKNKTGLHLRMLQNGVVTIDMTIRNLMGIIDFFCIMMHNAVRCKPSIL